MDLKTILVTILAIAVAVSCFGMAFYIILMGLARKAAADAKRYARMKSINDRAISAMEKLMEERDEMHRKEIATLEAQIKMTRRGASDERDQEMNHLQARLRNEEHKVKQMEKAFDFYSAKAE